MGRIDFIDASVKAYRFIARDYHALFMLGWVPVLAKLITFAMVVFLGMQDDFFKQGLLSLPATFIEGWFLAALLRLAILKEHYPANLTGDALLDKALIARRRFDIKIAVIAYVLIKLITTFIAGLIIQYSGIPLSGDTEAQVSAVQLPPYAPVLMIAGFIGMIWAFRYNWLYVPAALGVSSKAFLKRIHGMGASFQLMGIWIISFAPVFVVLLFISDILSSVFPEATITDGPIVFIALFGAAQSVIEVFISAVTSVAVGYAVYQVMQGGQDT